MLHDAIDRPTNPDIQPDLIDYAATMATRDLDDGTVSVAEAILDFAYLTVSDVAQRHLDLPTIGSAHRQARRAI